VAEDDRTEANAEDFPTHGGLEWAAAKRTEFQQRLDREGIEAEKHRRATREQDQRQCFGQKEREGHEASFYKLRGGLVWGKTAEEKDYSIYIKTQIAKGHPQERELMAATLLCTHPSGATARYRTPVGKAGSENGNTQVSATVFDQRNRGKGYEDQVQVFMKPEEKAGKAMARAQKLLDGASGFTWPPWEKTNSGQFCQLQSGERLKPEDTMPEEGQNIVLKGTKTGRKKATEVTRKIQAITDVVTNDERSRRHLF
jgi:hypothetical protein